MYKNKRLIGILLVLVTIISSIFPTVKVFAEGTGEIKAESKFQGVTYKLNPDVIQMPSGIDYEIAEEEKIDYTEYEESDRKSNKRKVSIPSDKSGRKGLFLRDKRKGTNNLPSSFNREEPAWNKDIVFEPTSITVDSQTVKKLSPEIGKTYFDPVNQTTFKVIDKPTTNSSGLTTIPVEKPEISEVITDVNIPQQTIELTEDDISYLHPELSKIETSRSQVTQTASISGFVPSTQDHWIKIDLDGLTLINEGSNVKNKEEAEERKTEAEKGTWRTEEEKKLFEEQEEKMKEEQKGDGSFSANVKITDGYIKIFKPELSASLEWEKLMFYADAKADIDIESDIIIEGEVKINKEVEILIQGFEVDFEIGKVACGIYLVLGVDGSVSFDVRVQQQGTVTVGAAARGVLIPMVVYPFVDYDNSAYESQVIINGKLKLWALAVPKVSLHILDWDVLSAKFRVGVEANAIFSTNLDESETFRLWIDLLLELRVQVIDLKEKVPFETRITLYERSKTRSKDEVGTPIDGGTEGGYKAKGFVLIDIDKMDAVRDIIRGTVTKAINSVSPPISCTGEEIIIKILHVDRTVTEHKVTLEEYGKFYLNTPITPLDMVSVSYDKVDIKYDYSSTTPYMNIQPPYKVISLFADAFNEKVIGEIDGEIYGPNEIAYDGDEVRFAGDIFVKLSGSNNSGGSYKIQPGDNGEFVLENFPLTKGNLVSAGLVFEEARIETELLEPELGLDIHYGLIESDDKSSFTIIGAIQNVNGDKLYKGNVKLYGGNKALLGDVKAEVPGEITPDSNNINSNKKVSLDIKTKLPSGINEDLVKEVPAKLSPKELIKTAIKGNEDIMTSTVFEFNVPMTVRQAAALGGVSIEIEHNGIIKKEIVISKMELPKPPELEKTVVSPIEDLINRRINPAMGRDMKHAIANQARIYQDAGANININQAAHSTLYSLVQTPMTQSSVYSFKEDSLKLNAQVDKNGISLSWNTNLDPTNIEGYRIYRGIAPGAEELVAITGATSIKDNKYIDTKVSSGTSYYYLCSVVYKNGDEFIISNEVMMTK